MGGGGGGGVLESCGGRRGRARAGRTGRSGIASAERGRADTNKQTWARARSPRTHALRVYARAHTHARTLAHTHTHTRQATVRRFTGDRRRPAEPLDGAISHAGAHAVLKGYSQGTQAVPKRYPSRYSQGTHGVLNGALPQPAGWKEL
jgi:hypothetical protein